MSSMYRAILSVLYPIFFIIVFPSQLLLIYIILRHSPKYLKTLQLVLFCNCVSQIVSLVLCCLLQTRQVSHLTPIEIWCYGPMRHFDAVIPYSMYFVAQVTNSLGKDLESSWNYKSRHISLEWKFCADFKSVFRFWLLSA